MKRRHLSPVPALSVVLGVSVLVGGCGIVDRVGGGQRAEACVSWVGFDTPADALDAAAVAVRTEGPTPVVGTTDLFGVDARVHAVTVAEVLKGTGVGAGDEIEVASTPVTCTGGEVYPDSDPLDAAGALILLVHRAESGDVWRTITPGQGVVPATVDGQLPDAWPAG